MTKWAQRTKPGGERHRVGTGMPHITNISNGEWTVLYTRLISYSEYSVTRGIYIISPKTPNATPKSPV